MSSPAFGRGDHCYPDAANGTHIGHDDVITLIAVFGVELHPPIEEVVDGSADSAAGGNFFQFYISFTQGDSGVFI